MSQQQHTTTSMTDRDYLTKLMAHPDLSEQEEKLLFVKARSGDMSARETLITHNMRLIAATVRTYRDQLGPRTAGGLEFTDLVDEGVIAVSRAIEKYDPRFGTFGPYAERAIQNQLAKALNDQEELVRLPQGASRLERTIFKIEDDRRTQGITEQLSDEQLAEMTGETVSMISHVRTAPRAVTSLQSPTESGGELGDLLADTHADERLDAETSALDVISANDLPVLLERIPEKNRRAIDLTFLQGKSLEDAATELGVSSTTVSKDIKRGLGQLRRAAKTQITQHETAATLQVAASKGAVSL